MMAGLIEPPCAAIGQQARLLELDSGFGDPALQGVVLIDGAAECGALRRSHHHELDQEFTQPDRAHAVMNACWPKPDLSNLEALAFLAQQIRPVDTDVIKGEFADRRDVIFTS